jgi:hypothetical protein
MYIDTGKAPCFKCPRKANLKWMSAQAVAIVTLTVTVTKTATPTMVTAVMVDGQIL